MTNIELMLMPPSIVAAIYWIIWQIKFPAETRAALLFKDGNKLLSIVTWVFLALFINAAVMTCRHLFN